MLFNWLKSVLWLDYLCQTCSELLMNYCLYVIIQRYLFSLVVTLVVLILCVLKMSEDSELKCAHSLANFPVSPKSKRWNRHINQSHDLLKHQDLSVSMPSLEPCKKHRYKKYARTVGTQTRSQHHIYSESSSMLKKGRNFIYMIMLECCARIISSPFE